MDLVRWITPLFLIALPAAAQTNSVQVEVANLREDVRGLVQKVNELSQRVEQLERENAGLKSDLAASSNARVTLNQLNTAIADLKRSLESSLATSDAKIRQDIAAQLKRMATETNTALDSLAKGQAARSAVRTNFSNDYPQEGVNYTVQKGDTLSDIVRRFNAKKEDVINANKIPNPDSLQVGQSLFIPTGSGK